MERKVLVVFEHSPTSNLGMSNEPKRTRGNAIFDFKVLSLDFIKAMKDKLTQDIDLKTGIPNRVSILNCIILENEEDEEV